MSFDLDSYNTVPERIQAFFEKYPNGALKQVKYELMGVGDHMFLVYTAAAYRTPEDLIPGEGTAWEPVPGKTQFTRDSEMQNAETSAWGRAIVAVGAADTRKGIASREDVQNRTAPPEPPPRTDLDDALDELGDTCAALGLNPTDVAAKFFAQEKLTPRKSDAKTVRAFTSKLLDDKENDQPTLDEAANG